MNDEFQKRFWWITEILENSSVLDFFKEGSTEYKIITCFKNGWGKRDTMEFLKELTSKYGDMAGQVVEKYLELNILKNLEEIGKREAHEGSEIEDFLRVLWKPLRTEGFEFSITRDSDGVSLCITKCPIYELAQKTGMHRWLYRLACSSDFHNVKGFSKKIGFVRTKTLIQGNECCNHQYYKLRP